MIGHNLITILNRSEKPGGKTGPWFFLCSFFGGLLVAYSGMTLVVFLIPAPVRHVIIVPFLFTPLAWALAALWISVAPNRLNALLRGLAPTLVFAMGILGFMARSQ